MRNYVLEAIRGFLRDPPDGDYQRGYLAALVTVYIESEDVAAIPPEVQQAQDLLGLPAYWTDADPM
jgi:hypothetical protein